MFIFFLLGVGLFLVTQPTFFPQTFPKERERHLRLNKEACNLFNTGQTFSWTCPPVSQVTQALIFGSSSVSLPASPGMPDEASWKITGSAECANLNQFVWQYASAWLQSNTFYPALTCTYFPASTQTQKTNFITASVVFSDSNCAGGSSSGYPTWFSYNLQPNGTSQGSNGQQTFNCSYQSDGCVFGMKSCFLSAYMQPPNAFTQC